MNVSFRVDSSIEIGTGHVMRCLALADEMKRLGYVTTFITRDHPGNIVNFIEAKGHTVYRLPAPKGQWINSSDDVAHARWLGLSWEEDAQETDQIICETKPDWLVVDHYGIDARWHLVLNDKIENILVIDDLADRKLHCALLLDQTYGRQREDYEHLVPANCLTLLGSEYALLRSDFSILREKAIEKREQAKSISQILVAMGGMDSHNTTELVLNSLAKIDWEEPPVIDVVLSSRAPHLESVKRCSVRHPLNVSVSSDVDNMAERMINADFSIGACGTTSWERCCLGLPSLTMSIAANQEVIAKQLDAAGVTYYLGNIANVTELNIRKALWWLFEDMERVSGMVSRCFDVADGLGVSRVINKIKQ